MGARRCDGRGLVARPAVVPEPRCRSLGAGVGRRAPAAGRALLAATLTGLTSIRAIEAELATLSEAAAPPGETTTLRTRVMTHVAWVPAAWEQAARGVLAGARRAASVADDPAAAGPRGGRERDRSRCRSPLLCRRWPEPVRCSEVVTIRLKGSAASAPASVVQPLLVSDLPAFLRWRGPLPLAAPELEQLVDVVERLIVDSREWEDPESGYRELPTLFSRVAVSDIAWARIEPWRLALSHMWRGRRGESPPRHRPRGRRASALALARRAPPAQDRARERHRARGGARRGRRTAGAAGPSDAEVAERAPVRSARDLRPRPDLRGDRRELLRGLKRPKRREQDAEGGPVTHATLDQHDAAVRTDDPVHRSEPESAAGEGAGSGALVSTRARSGRSPSRRKAARGSSAS